VRDSNYFSRTVWDVIVSSMRCLLTTPLYGNALEIDEAIGQLGLEVHELYARDVHGIRVNDLRVSVKDSPPLSWSVEILMCEEVPSVAIRPPMNSKR
jgi:hypothetical protein